MTTKEAINVLENEMKCIFRDSCERHECASCALVMPVEPILSAYYMAIAALREQKERENPAPLTLEELRQMKDEPVYLKLFDPLLTSGWHIIKAVTSDKIIYKGWQHVYTPIDGLGVDYNLYQNKPKEVPNENP